MLSPADSDLVERDVGLPGLATLLDPVAFVDAWRRHSGDAAVADAALTYLRYKPGTNCIAAYRIRSAQASRCVYAKAFGADAADKLQKARGRLPGIVCGNLGIAAFAFPADAKLRTLSRLAVPARRRALLTRIFDGSEAHRDGALDPLAYKPERRYVARFEPANGTGAVLKFYAPEGFPAAARSCKAFASRGVLRIPRKSGGSKRHRILAFEWLRGAPLREILADPAADVGVLARVGAALGELHAQGDASLARRSAPADTVKLLELATTLGFLCPSLASRAAALAARVAASLAGTAGVPRAIHGDFYDKQVLVGAERIAILDLDQAAWGDPRSDLGLFVAHLERDCLLGRLDAARFAAAAGELVEGYQQTAGVPVAGLGVHVADGLLRLAHHPFRGHMPGWPDATARILDRVDEILAGPR